MMNAALVEQSLSSGRGSPIVREVDGIVFSLPSATRQGAEQARVSLSDLARYLGYANKQSLERLADRNAAELAEVGEIATVAISVQRGAVTYQALEPAYNPDQCILLGLASQTEIGRAIRVRILKACKALLAEFEQRPLTPIRQLLAIVQAQADIEERQLEQERRAADAQRRISTLESSEAKRQQAENNAFESLRALPPPTVGCPDKSLRATINECVRSYAISHGGGAAFREAWRKLYQEFRDRHHIDAKARAKSRACEPLDVVEAAGLLPQLYAVAIEVLRIERIA
jgi:hypothetical protein